MMPRSQSIEYQTFGNTKHTGTIAKKKELQHCLNPRRQTAQRPAQQAKSAGFTLIELLVVIAIIAILASILFPVFARPRKRAAHVLF